MEWKKKVDTNLGITIILVFAALFTIVDFYIVGSELDGYPFNELSGNVVNDSNNIIEHKDVDNEEDNGIIIDDKNSDNNCLLDGYCLLYDKENVKIEYNFLDEQQNVNPTLSFNEREVSLNGMLNKYDVLNDNYLFVVYGGPSGDGRPLSFLIFDLFGNVLTDIDGSTLSNSFSVFEVEMKDNMISYSGKPFNFNLEGFCKLMIGDESNYMSSTNIIDKYDSLIFVKEEYNYIGGGKISKINRIEKSVIDYMKESTGYDNCQDAINNIDSWKNMSIYSFYK
jgi:hypothetical protein